MSLFEFDEITVNGERGPILERVTASIPAQGVTVIMGPSGAGKSTLLRLCNRLAVPDAGVVRFRGNDVAALDPLVLRRRVGMVFQRPTMFGGTVADNLRVAVPDAGDDALVRALDLAGLGPEFLDRVAGELSGGEAQRACLARTLITEPEAVLMDEPASALDAGPRLGLERLARALADGGVPVVWVTHFLDQAQRLADRALVLVRGRLRHAGSVDELTRSEDPELVRFLTGGTDPGTAGEATEADDGR